MKIIYLILGFGLLSFSPVVNAQKLKSRIQTQSSSSGRLHDELIKEYDKNENLIKQVYKDFRGIPTRTSFYIVDDKGRMISDSTYNSDNKLIEVCSYEYNEKDDILFQKRSFFQDSAYYEERYDRTYDSKGNEIEFKEFSKEGKLLWNYKFKYDSHGNEIKRLNVVNGKVNEEWINKYKNGHCIYAKVYLFVGDKLKRRKFNHYFYEYNKQGQKVKMTVHTIFTTTEKKVIGIHEYKYDDRGNMIEENSFKDGNLISIKKIKYIYW